MKILEIYKSIKLLEHLDKAIDNKELARHIINTTKTTLLSTISKYTEKQLWCLFVINQILSENNLSISTIQKSLLSMTESELSKFKNLLKKEKTINKKIVFDILDNI